MEFFQIETKFKAPGIYVLTFGECAMRRGPGIELQGHRVVRYEKEKEKTEKEMLRNHC